MDKLRFSMVRVTEIKPGHVVRWFRRRWVVTRVLQNHGDYVVWLRAVAKTMPWKETDMRLGAGEIIKIELDPDTGLDRILPIE